MFYVEDASMFPCHVVLSTLFVRFPVILITLYEIFYVCRFFIPDTLIKRHSESREKEKNLARQTAWVYRITEEFEKKLISLLAELVFEGKLYWASKG